MSAGHGSDGSIRSHPRLTLHCQARRVLPERSRATQLRGAFAALAEVQKISGGGEVEEDEVVDLIAAARAGSSRTHT